MALWNVSRSSRVLLTTMLLFVSAGCSAAVTVPHPAAPSTPAVVFPTRDDLAKVPSKALSPDAFSTNAAPVESWTFTKPPPESVPAYDDPTRWGELLRAVVSPQAKEVTPSAPLRCAAAEIAHFYLQKEAMPTESLQRFAIARCGGTAVDVAPLLWGGTADVRIADDEIFERSRAEIDRALAKSLVRGRYVVGLAFARAEERFVVVGLVGRDDARIDAGSLRADASREVVVRGTLHDDAADVFAMINRGEFGAAACDAGPRDAPRQFAFTCRLADGDTVAWAQVTVRREGRLLLTPVAELLVRTADAGALLYRAPSSGRPALVEAPSELSAAIIDGVNTVRARARLVPLAPATHQGAENTRLAGTLIDALLERDDTVGDRIALGLIAGWEVDGLIRRGSLYVGRVGGPARDARMWIDNALEQPLGRLVLLDPAARQIAIGPAMPEGVPALGAVVTTYTFFESADHTEDIDRFLRLVAAARAARGMPQVTRVPAKELAEAARKVLELGEQPTAALDAAMKGIVSRTPVRVEGFLLEANDLEHVQVPDALLRSGPLRVSLEVTHHRAPGAAWGQLVVFIVIISPLDGGPLRRL